MEAIISDLVSRFEKGALTRRGLIQGLAMLTAASGTVAVAEDQDAATRRYRSGTGAGRPSFLVSGVARVLAVDTTSRSGVARLDLEPFDGTLDAELQIGPVFRGTALRDALPFIRFDDFTNQMEYASVSRVLHDRVADSVVAKVGRARLAGRVIEFEGAYTEDAGIPLITPVVLRVRE